VPFTPAASLIADARTGAARNGFYAVIGGLEGNRIYSSWDRTKSNTNGVPAAKQKRFNTIDLARAQLRQWGVVEHVECEE